MMLRFIDDETYRRRILVQLNRGETRTMFHGKRGELRQRYREGQEDQLGALGLLVNLVVLWNTIYIDASLNRLRTEGHVILDEDVARLSPLGFQHINMLGATLSPSPTWSRAASFGRSVNPAPRAPTMPEAAPYVGFLFRCYSTPSSSGDDLSATDVWLAELGLSRETSAEAPYLAAGPIITQTEMMAIMARHIGQEFRRAYAVRLVELPFQLAAVRCTLVWHNRLLDHPAHSWMRRVIQTVATE